jgi:hypothetical protein
MDLRLAAGPQTIARIPQAPHQPRRLAPGAPGSLIGGVLRDALELQAVDPARGVVARDFVQP